jgi:hypothetical protein
MPIKRHATLKAKPKLIVPVSKKAEGAAVPTAPMATVTPTTLPPTTPQPTSKHTRHVKKRRFSERRLTLSVKNEAKTRKHQRSVKRQVAAMTVEDIRSVLKEKGILKPKSNPPESMLRSMMQDYLSLKTV